jgi:hypothetical protein
MLAFMNKRRRRASVGRVALVAGLIAVGLTGCGVKLAPKFPDGTVYPLRYPEPLPALVGKPDTKKSGAGESGAAAPPSGIYQYPNPQGYKPPAE